MKQTNYSSNLFDEAQKRLQHMQSLIDRIESADGSRLSPDELAAELQYLCESSEIVRLLIQMSLSADLNSV
ncbi:hypothetical protein IFO70_32845 [Phormidium tenue FACHB-886]|nr:hypothetical protein [Phormidium tenue FACHB-886]